MSGKERGSRGEDFAAETLGKQGYRILARNRHSRWGEIDIIAQKDEIICFVEVKTRRQDPAVTGSAAVGRSKQQKILRTALLFLQEHPDYDWQPRFDLFLVETDTRGHILSYDHMEGAFDGDAYEGSTGD